MTQYPQQAPAPGGTMRPHRGAIILVLGILSFLVCFILGIVAWVMANSDLKAMRMGTMDPSGEGLTKAGKIIAIISIVLNIISIIIMLAVFVFGVGLAMTSTGGIPGP